MHRVEHPTMFHAQCAFTKRTSDPDGFIDLGMDFDMDHQGRIYIAAQWVKDAAQLLGYPLPQTVSALEEQLEASEESLARAREELQELRAFKDAVHVMKHHDYQSARKPGRPKGSGTKVG
jgi:hypothetical protein